MTPTIADDWRAESEGRLQKTDLFKALQASSAKESDAIGSHLLSLVNDIAHYAHNRTKLVIRHMPEYTLHDADHLFRVLHLMERLIPTRTMTHLSAPELLLLIASAFLHDIGMAPSESEVIKWLSYWDNQLPASDPFTQFVAASPERLSEIARLREQGMHSLATVVQQHLVAEYIRKTHGERCKQILADDWAERIRYRDVDLTAALASVCFSHTDDAFSLLKLDNSLICGPDTYACLPFVGVILRLADILDFDAKRTPSVLFAHLGVRHPVSLQEWQKHRAINAWIISPTHIAFAARCSHPAIESAIRQFCDIIDRELVACAHVLRHLSNAYRDPFPEYYRPALPPQIVRDQIGPNTDVRGDPVYQYRDTRFSLSQAQIIDLLMGTRLYGNRTVAIRELVQNSIDACLLRKALEDSWGNKYEPAIAVTFSAEAGQESLRVIDNGMGMDEGIIDRHFSRIGSSFYKSAEFYALQAQHNMEFVPISRFGIGILSCFMVADTLKVETRRLRGPHESSQPIEVRIEGLDSIFWIIKGTKVAPGTSTELYLRPNNPWSGSDDAGRIAAVVATIPHPPFPITIRSGDLQSVHDGSEFAIGVSKEWGSSPHVRRIEVSIEDCGLGIAGSGAIAILVDSTMPVPRKELFRREVAIEGDDPLELHTELSSEVNKIRRSSDSLEVCEDKIEKSSNGTEEVGSTVNLAVHGIAVPVNVIDEWWRGEGKKTVLRFPFAVNLQIDVVGTRDLNLNGARSEIVHDDKWLHFATTISYLICRSVKAKTKKRFWTAAVKIWSSQAAMTPEFLAGLAKVNDE